MQRLIHSILAVYCTAGCSLIPISNMHVAYAAPWNEHGRLKVSENKRFLQHQNGTPFFYLGDTAWELFHRISREEAEKYLENRKQKGFTVIQAVGLAELKGLDEGNYYGDLPLIDKDPTKPNEKYWKHVDWVIDKAAEKGLYIGLLPTWGSHVNDQPVINVDNARAFGEWIGNRYKKKPNIIWILGGDRTGQTQDKDFRPIWRAVAKGIKIQDSNHLITYHPPAGTSSSTWFHDDSWLDFNMIQTGHSNRHNRGSYLFIESDYNRSPVKPTLDGEIRYEDHPIAWNPSNGYFRSDDVRQAAYWSVFAGGAGVTYGHHSIWQFYGSRSAQYPVSHPEDYWYNKLNSPASSQMRHLKNLILSRPFFSRVPDTSIIAGKNEEGASHMRATRGDGYAFVYFSLGQSQDIQMSKISGDIRCWWYDPRSGKAQEIGQFNNSGVIKFDAPGNTAPGNDWILVMDDISKGYGKPGMR